VAAPGGAGKPETITTPGTLPASSPVTLSTPGTYYWQSSYSGDANNAPSTSTCGTTGEVETVTKFCGSADVGYQATPTVRELGYWAGYAAESSTACTFTSVTGQWVQPALACPEYYQGLRLITTFWVGLDGAMGSGSKSVEQTGIEAECIWDLFSYHTQYRAWYQMYPDKVVYWDSLDPQPGSLVKATVTYLSNGEYSLDLTVTTKDSTLEAITEQKCTHLCENKSAEWVLEKQNNKNYDLAAFALPWDLTDGTATTAADPAIEQTVASFKPVIDIIDKDRYLYAFPTQLDGSSFDVVLNSVPPG
jgi:hypothetical protein